MKRFLFLLFCFPGIAVAQYHEIKVDLFPATLRTVQGAYEWVYQDRWGLEFQAGHKWDKLFILKPDVPEYRGFRQRKLILSFALKKYFQTHLAGTRLFAGITYNKELTAYIDPAYADFYRSVRGYYPDARTYERSGPGITAGYKKNFDSGWILEAGFSYDFNIAPLLRLESKYIDLKGLLNIKVGYRL